MERWAKETAITILGNITDIELLRKVSAFFYGDIIIEGKLIITKDCIIPWGLYILGSIEADKFSIEVCGDILNSGNINAFELKVRKNLYNVDNGKIDTCFIDVKRNFYNESCIKCACDIKVRDRFYNSGTISSNSIDVDVYDNIINKGILNVKDINYKAIIAKNRKAKSPKKKE